MPEAVGAATAGSVPSGVPSTHSSGSSLAQHRLPPQNIEAEESILCSLLIDSDSAALFDILEILTPEDFYKSSHKIIFEAVRTLVEKNDPVDIVTVKNLLQGTSLSEKRGQKNIKNQLEAIGGAAYLTSLVDEAPVAVNVRHYAKIIKSKASLRALIENANEITKRCFENPAEVDSVIDFAESSILQVAGGSTAQDFSSLHHLLKINMEAIESNDGKWITGVPSGFDQLDNLTSGFQKSDLIILAARPSMGKTALALNIARNAAVDHNQPVAVFSLEMSKEQLSMRLLTAESRINSASLRRGQVSKQDWLRITNAASVLDSAPIYIDDSSGITSMEVRAKSRRLKKEKDIGLIIVDYLQLMRASNPKERRDLDVGEMSASLKGLAKELNVPVIVLSQLSRAPEQNNNKRPMLSHLRESGALEQDADVVLFIYRDEVYNKDEDNPQRGLAEIIIGKQRNGPVGDITLQFEKTYTRFQNLASEPYDTGNLH